MDEPTQPDPALVEAVRRFREAAEKTQTRQETLRQSFEKAQSELQRTRQALVAALEALSRAAALVDPTGAVLASNARFSDLNLADAERILEPRLRALLAEADPAQPFEGRFERRVGGRNEVLLVEARPAGETRAWVIQLWRATGEPASPSAPERSPEPDWAARARRPRQGDTR